MISNRPRATPVRGFVPNNYAAGLEILCPGGACLKLGPAIPSTDSLARSMPRECEARHRSFTDHLEGAPSRPGRVGESHQERKLTKLVPENYRLISEVRQAIISADPLSQSKWDSAHEFELTGREALRQGNPADIQPAIDKIASAQKCRDELHQHADEEIRGALRSKSLTPLTSTGDRILDHDWRGDFDSDYIVIAGKRELVYFERPNIESFISELFNLPTLKKLPAKQRIVVEYLRKNFPSRDYGHLGKLKSKILMECPALDNSLDDNTFRGARKFLDSISG